ncbi:MAG: hypothetical protein AAGA93_20495 [Actinomycetota bacterium]
MESRPTRGVSRDEAREVAIVALLMTLVLRLGAGVLQAVDELNGPTETRELLVRLFAQVGSTVGILTLGCVLIVVLSPRGSVSTGTADLVRRVAATVTVLGLLGALNTLTLPFTPMLGRLWLSMINGLAAATLAGAGYWILRNFDDER